jgi:hypothetical protein
MTRINSNQKTKTYPVIKVPANGNPNWVEGARTMCFVYSKHNGNFILEGYRGEVETYLKKNYTHYFCYFSMWCNGESRGHWRFWKENIGIFSPCRSRILGIRHKYIIRRYHHMIYCGPSTENDNDDTKNQLEFKRLPKRWIPEFDNM